MLSAIVFKEYASPATVKGMTLTYVLVRAIEESHHSSRVTLLPAKITMVEDDYMARMS
jgi:hypothetical protein